MSDEPKFNIIEWDMMDRTKFLSLTVVNSFVIRSFLYPLVLVKTRLQIQKQNTVYSGSLDAFKKIIKTEGCRGLYRGFWINSMQALSNITYIVTYEKTRDLVSNYTNISANGTKAFLSGGISSAVSQTLIIPCDIVSQHIMINLALKHRKQASPKGHLHKSSEFKSSYFKPLETSHDEVRRFGVAIAIGKQLWREGGIKSFYRGYFASLICYVPSGACWWLLNQQFSQYLYNLSWANDKHYVFLHTISGAMTGGLVSIMTNPLDLLRANIQVHRPSSYRSAVKYLVREDGLRVFTKGLTARLTQSCISSALVAVGYESLKRYSLDEKYRDQFKW